ncbi:hypothetical protein OPV22_021825 [Ensete ventricosum]|uniref:Biotin synthase n=1 Tax=Ensete ventricosum TaxID=4639 RepID=A0AAV8QM34_ENSVE|nr:hypothetical protein OPV22_021825 [Ensete ventricosum]
MGAAWRDTIGRKTNFNQMLEYVTDTRATDVREAGISVCSGGIIGLGKAEEDRVGLLRTLATLHTHPENVPINALVAVKGTPLQDQKPVERDLIDDSDDHHSSYCNAKGNGEAIHRQGSVLNARAGALLFGWGQFHLHRREITDDSKR